jgi:hypothetical protein
VIQKNYIDSVFTLFLSDNRSFILFLERKKNMEKSGKTTMVGSKLIVEVSKSSESSDDVKFVNLRHPIYNRCRKCSNLLFDRKKDVSGGDFLKIKKMSSVMYCTNCVKEFNLSNPDTSNFTEKDLNFTYTEIDGLYFLNVDKL